MCHTSLLYFYPRSPWGERQASFYLYATKLMISIHAPRGGSDSFGRFQANHSHKFLSTLPVGSDLFYIRCCKPTHISIHAPRGGATRIRRDLAVGKKIYRRSPWGERHVSPLLNLANFHDFYPRSPWGERQRRVECLCGQNDHFLILRSPWGSDKIACG